MQKSSTSWIDMSLSTKELNGSTMCILYELLLWNLITPDQSALFTLCLFIWYNLCLGTTSKMEKSLSLPNALSKRQQNVYNIDPERKRRRRINNCCLLKNVHDYLLTFTCIVVWTTFEEIFSIHHLSNLFFLFSSAEANAKTCHRSTTTAAGINDYDRLMPEYKTFFKQSILGLI